MFGAGNAKKTSSKASRGVLLGLGLLLLAGSALACGPGAAQSAIQTPQTSEKFALASEFCLKNRVPGLHVQPARETAPLDASAHSQQLWLYDKPAEVVAGGVMSAPLPPVDTPVRPAAAGISPRTAEVPRLVKGMGRDAASRALALVPQISQVAEAYRIDPLLLHAIAHVESRHNPAAVSHAGAVGLMQVMPATARRFGVTSPHSELRDPRISLEVSSAYLKVLQKRFDNNLPLIIAAYNAGEGAVEKYGRRIPPYKETQGYVRDVLAHYQMLLGARDAARPVRRSAL